MIEPKECPICNRETNFAYSIKYKDGDSLWYECPCGVISQKEFSPTHKRGDLSETDAHQRHAVKVYAQLIEELTYGRHMLHIGYERSPAVMKEFSQRGWITWGIDEDAESPGKNLYKGDFMFYPFTPKVEDIEISEELEGNTRQFDLVWFASCLERQVTPLRALDRVYELLTPAGVLFITTPDVDYIYSQGVGGWPHWQKDDNNVLWTKRALDREVERKGFKVIMSRRNASVRFMQH